MPYYESGNFAHIMRPRFLIPVAVVGFLASIPLSVLYSTHRHMAVFRARIQPGMSLADLVHFAGEPAKIVHSGESLGLASHRFRRPPLDAHTVMYAYPKEGFPYYNVFVFVDTEQDIVVGSTIEQL